MVLVDHRIDRDHEMPHMATVPEYMAVMTWWGNNRPVRRLRLE